jgi:hypothetical protein
LNHGKVSWCSCIGYKWLTCSTCSIESIALPVIALVITTEVYKLMCLFWLKNSAFPFPSFQHWFLSRSAFVLPSERGTKSHIVMQLSTDGSVNEDLSHETKNGYIYLLSPLFQNMNFVGLTASGDGIAPHDFMRWSPCNTSLSEKPVHIGYSTNSRPSNNTKGTLPCLRNPLLVAILNHIHSPVNSSH